MAGRIAVLRVYVIPLCYRESLAVTINISIGVNRNIRMVRGLMLNALCNHVQSYVIIT